MNEMIMAAGYYSQLCIEYPQEAHSRHSCFEISNKSLGAKYQPHIDNVRPVATMSPVPIADPIAGSLVNACPAQIEDQTNRSR